MPKTSRKLTQREIQNLWQIYQSVAPDLHKLVDDLTGNTKKRRNDPQELRRQFDKIVERLEKEGIDDMPL